MKRVAKKKGWVCVIDIAPAEDKAEAFNRFEKLRDPSHTRALSIPELKDLGREAGLKNISLDFCGLERDLESQLAGSFPARETRKKSAEFSRRICGPINWGSKAAE
jgi:hypothetical protein